MESSMVIYVLLAIVGTLLLGWGAWVTSSALDASTKRAEGNVADAFWRGGIEQKVNGIIETQKDIRATLDEIRVYLRSNGWKPADRE